LFVDTSKMLIFECAQDANSKHLDVFGRTKSNEEIFWSLVIINNALQEIILRDNNLA